MKRVLLVEPSQELAIVIGQSLEKQGLFVDHSATAQGGVSLADGQRPDVVVLELALPEHNGLEFLYELRSYTDWADIPIVIYSRISAEEFGLDEAQVQKLGIAAHLYKPTSSLKKLHAAVFEVL
jgi:two-component system KDP operon response regulator KdpE